MGEGDSARRRGGGLSTEEVGEGDSVRRRGGGLSTEGDLGGGGGGLSTEEGRGTQHGGGEGDSARRRWGRGTQYGGGGDWQKGAFSYSPITVDPAWRDE